MKFLDLRLNIPEILMDLRHLEHDRSLMLAIIIVQLIEPLQSLVVVFQGVILVIRKTTGQRQALYCPYYRWMKLAKNLFLNLQNIWLELSGR